MEVGACSEGLVRMFQVGLDARGVLMSPEHCGAEVDITTLGSRRIGLGLGVSPHRNRSRRRTRATSLRQKVLMAKSFNGKMF